MTEQTHAPAGASPPSRSWLVRIPEYVIAALVAVLVLFLSIAVFTRYVLGSGFVWSDEAGRVLFVWVVFLGVAIGLRHRGHIGVELLVDRLPRDWRQRIYVLQDALILVFCAMLTWLSIDSVRFATRQRLPALEISIAWLYASVLVSGVFLTLYAALNFWDTLRGKSHRADVEGSEAQRHLS